VLVKDKKISAQKLLIMIHSLTTTHLQLSTQ